MKAQSQHSLSLQIPGLKDNSSQLISLCRYLASGGKDRSLLIHECAHLDPEPSTSRHQHSFTPLAFLKNAHKRIIWDLTSDLSSLCPLTSLNRWVGDSGELLATASRDGNVKIWKISQDPNALSLLWTFSPFDGTAVTSIDSTLRMRSIGGSLGWLLIMGAENGSIQIWMLPSCAAPYHLHTISPSHIHGATVSKIKWKESSLSEDLKFASCGEDHAVRVFRCSS